jgi:hypothetical protein
LLHDYFEPWSVQAQAEVDEGRPSWFNVFELMRSMPRLMKVRFSGLRQSYNCEGKLLGTSQSDTGAPQVFRTFRMRANKPGVVAILGLAIEQSVLIKAYEQGSDYFEVRFVERIEGLNLPTIKRHPFVKKGRKGLDRALGDTLFFGMKICMLNRNN